MELELGRGDGRMEGGSVKEERMIPEREKNGEEKLFAETMELF